MNLQLNPKELTRRGLVLALYVFGSSITSFVLGADWWIIALVAVATTIAVVAFELLRIRRAVLRSSPPDGKRVLPPRTTVPPPPS